MGRPRHTSRSYGLVLYGLWFLTGCFYGLALWFGSHSFEGAVGILLGFCAGALPLLVALYETSEAWYD